MKAFPIELRWVVPKRTTTKQAKLQWRSTCELGFNGEFTTAPVYGPWEFVPTVVVSHDEFFADDPFWKAPSSPAAPAQTQENKG